MTRRSNRTLVSLAERRLEPREDVVETLQELLDAAKRGEVRGVAVGFVLIGTEAGWSYATGDASHGALYLECGRVMRRLEALMGALDDG